MVIRIQRSELDKMTPEIKYHFRWVYLLPCMHLFGCLVIGIARLDTAWGYMFMIDIPMSVIILAFSYNFNHPFLLFGTLGTLWWYLLSRAAEMIYRGVTRRRPEQ